MDLQTLNRANAVQARIEELEKNLAQVEELRLDFNNGESLTVKMKAGASADVVFKYQFLPIDTDKFLYDYIKYLKHAIAQQKELLATI